MSDKIQIGAYYFPNYHVDKRNEIVHGRGWTEWQLVNHATPRFKDHQQPKVPLWGYENEADPKVMEKKINAAADNGIDFWIFDWYWYDDGPFLDRCLEEGFMGASNNSRVKFCCMWANHDWHHMHPAGIRARAEMKIELLYPGKVSEKTFDTITTHIVEKYFKHPSHFNIDGCPYFSVYDLNKLLQSFGSIRNTRKAFDSFRKKTKDAGFKDLHLNAVVWGRPNLPGESVPLDPAKLMEDLGFDSVTSYVWIHHVGLTGFPYTPYNKVRDEYFLYWDNAAKTFSIPYFPNVSMGWDTTPRFVQSDILTEEYEFGKCIDRNTPQEFKTALKMAKEKLEKQPGPKIMNINSWNEWTEGSYLEPDKINGMGYLEAIKEIFRK